MWSNADKLKAGHEKQVWEEAPALLSQGVHLQLSRHLDCETAITICEVPPRKEAESGMVEATLTSPYL